MKKLISKDAPSFDVIVIGGGASGMMASLTAAKHGARTLLLEKNTTLGKKLLISGGGRCNVTNAEFDIRKLLNRYNTKSHKSDQFLFSAFSQFSVQEALEFFHSHGMETKIEAAQRVFPKSDKAQSVFDVLVREMKSTGVVVQSSVTVEKILTDKDTVTGIQIKGGKILTAKKYIIATGGKSHPETGSTGDGFTWLQDIGHTVIDTSSALVPLALKESHISKLAGISLSDIKITVLQNDKRHDTQKGKILFTHVGVTGPTILNMSKDIGELLAYGQVFLSLDLFPTLDHKELDGRIMRYMFENSNKKFKNSFTELLPQALLTTLIDIVEIDGEMQCNGLPKYKRQAFVHLLKDIRYEVKGLLGTDKAVVTSGGVDLKEVDFKTMQSRIFQNLYIIGDMLHIDRPSGGFSLQLCWTTGVVAGMSAAREE